MKIHIDYSVMNRRYDIYAFEDRLDGMTNAYRVTIEKIPGIEECGTLPITASLRPPEMRALAKALREALREAGMMDTPQPSATSAELDATKCHLEDFRKLVFSRGVCTGPWAKEE